MATFFPQSRGVVKRVDGPHPLSPFFISLDGARQPFTSAIITQAGVVRSGNYQFLHTLDDTVFVYVFGRRIGELRVSGVGFSANCDGQQAGSDQVIDWFENNQLSASGRPVIVGLGGRRFRGFLTGMQLDVVDAETQLSQWSLRFNTFPAK